MQYVFKSVFAKSKRAQEPTFLRSFFWCGRWDFPGCFTFYAPHDAKAAIKMFAQKGNSSIDEFPFCS